MKRYVIFGGTGFIGTHLSQFLLNRDPHCHIVLVDLDPPRHTDYAAELRAAYLSGRVGYLQHDTRLPIDPEKIGPVDTVFNLAAVHREPGHQPDEYFRTNIQSAENVCGFASAVGAKHVVFTSSISVYGATEAVKTEESLTAPETPYGSSKLVAETIHRVWASAAPDRKLLILRPGVVYGPGEGGNVTRLVRSVVKGYFAYMGNRSVRKAGGYVKELCEVIQFGMDCQLNSEAALLVVNFTESPVHTVEAYVDSIRVVANVGRRPFSVPRRALLALSYAIEAVAGVLRIKQPISPTRIRKLYRSTNIEAKKLNDLGYEYKYSLQSAFSDWKHEVPEDFGSNPAVAHPELSPDPGGKRNVVDYV